MVVKIKEKLSYSGAEHRTVEFCTDECKSIINQLLGEVE